MWKLTLVVFAAAALIVSCSSGEQTETAGQTADETELRTDVTPADFDLSGQTVTLAGITFTPPADWTDMGPSGMRKASYYWGPVEGDTDSATVTVFYFGPTGGGSIEDNLDRWVSQMVVEGAETAPKPTKTQIEVDDMPVHLVSAIGAYSGSMGPMGSSAGAKQGYYMIGAVVEAPEGNVFFKLTGPEATAREMGDAFMAMVKGVKKA
jgi:hypothetical protein